jgi:DNA-binding beta-propeller fold protein YncE
LEAFVKFVAVLSVLFLLVSFSGCADALEPAGPGQYANPDYPSDMFGYAIIPETFEDGFLHQERVYILDRTSQSMISFSSTDPDLADPEFLVNKDTLVLGFQPGASCFDSNSETLFVSDASTNDIYRLSLSGGGEPQFLCSSESVITSLYPIENGSSLVVCFLGPEWLARKIDAVSGQVEKEYSTGWPITRAALSTDENRLLLSNSGREYLIEIDTDTILSTDTIPMPQRLGPFLYNTSGDIDVCNQYTVKPRVYLLDGVTKSIMDVVECINPYKHCFLMPGTDVVLAPRRSDNRVSVLNTENMVFAPSIFCISYAEVAFSSPENNCIVVLSDSPGRGYIYNNTI